MEFESFADLVHKVNISLGNFCNEFQYKRKQLTGAGRTAGNNELFGNIKDDDGWAINKGGGTEVQYHIAFDEDVNKVRYGLGFNTQYVPFATNSISPQDLMKPFMTAFLQKEDKIQKELPDYSFIYGNREQLLNPDFDQYTLFGKEILAEENDQMYVLRDADFQSMLNDLKRQFPVYVEIFETRNNIKSMEKEVVLTVNLLKYKKQIILQGPPGTGKTKLAKELAIEIVYDNNNDSSNLLTLSKEQIVKLFPIGTKLTTVAGNNFYIVKSNSNDKIELQRENGSTDFTTYSKILEYFNSKKWKLSINGNDERRAAALAKYAYDHLERPSQSSRSETQIKLIQFHPSYSYEDFVRGIVAESKGNQIEYKNVNKIIAKIAQEAKNNWDDSQKESKNVSKENKVREYFEQFTDQLSEKITAGELISLTPNVNLIDVEEDAFRYKGKEGWTELGNRMLFRDIIQAFLDENKVRQDIKKNKNLSGLAIQHASYFVRVLNMFQEFLNKNKLGFENLSSERVQLRNYVLIIDEINRANLSSVLGELIYALEYRNEAVESMYAVNEDPKIILPPNLYIIGTMNTADRSVGHIDYAIRRRFAFVDVNPKDLSGELEENFHKALFDAVSNLFVTNLSPEFDKKDVQLGHSYFIDKSKEGGSMDIRLEYEIKPILREYIKDGILIGDNIETQIEQLSI